MNEDIYIRFVIFMSPNFVNSAVVEYYMDHLGKIMHFQLLLKRRTL